MWENRKDEPALQRVGLSVGAVLRWGKKLLDLRLGESGSGVVNLLAQALSKGGARRCSLLRQALGTRTPNQQSESQYDRSVHAETRKVDPLHFLRANMKGRDFP